jgi:hypothetical protein
LKFLEEKVWEDISIQIKMECFRKILNEASKTYSVTVVLTDDELYNDASFKENNSIHNRRTTVSYFIHHHLSQLNEGQQEFLITKYSASVRTEQMKENRTTKKCSLNS